MKDKTYTFFYSKKQANVGSEWMFMDIPRNNLEVLVDGEWVEYSERRQGLHLKNNWSDCMVVHVSDDYQLRINGIVQ